MAVVNRQPSKLGPSTGRVYYEPQVSEGPPGMFWMTLTISAGDNYWTSGPARLFVADMEAALAEAERQTRALATVLRGAS